MTDLRDVDWLRIPAPENDGAADHLPGLKLPSLGLMGTDDTEIDLSAVAGRSIVYAYPMTARPGTPLPDGWDMLPGARGCTPQSCAFRDHAAELKALGADRMYGLSTQETDYQKEAADRLHLPFPLLSDSSLSFARAASLPMFEVHGKILLKRLTMIVDDGVVGHVFYPVFPPDRNARDVMDWLSHHPRAKS